MNFASFGWDGQKRSGKTVPPGEWPLHTEIYRARPDVDTIVHTHPLWDVIFGVVGMPFQAVSQGGVMFSKGFNVLTGGPVLIRTKEQGKGVVAALADGNALLFPNHDITLVGSTIEEALMLALNLELAMKFQLMAASYGGIRGVVEPAVAESMSEAFIKKRTEDIFVHCVRESERAL